MLDSSRFERVISVPLSLRAFALVPSDHQDGRMLFSGSGFSAARIRHADQTRRTNLSYQDYTFASQKSEADLSSRIASA
jgi:hypothetical protein